MLRGSISTAGFDILQVVVIKSLPPVWDGRTHRPARSECVHWSGRILCYLSLSVRLYLNTKKSSRVCTKNYKADVIITELIPSHHLSRRFRIPVVRIRVSVPEHWPGSTALYSAARYSPVAIFTGKRESWNAVYLPWQINIYTEGTLGMPAIQATEWETGDGPYFQFQPVPWRPDLAGLHSPLYSVHSWMTSPHSSDSCFECKICTRDCDRSPLAVPMFSS